MLPLISVFASSVTRWSVTAGAPHRCPSPSRHLLRKFTASTTTTDDGDTCANSNAPGRGVTVAARQQPPFGIVAAITKEGIIGINGKLPWITSIPQDLNHYVNLTRNKILIVGRKSFAEDDPNSAHVRHVRLCIVVSTTMTASDSLGRGDMEVKIARSFDDALNLASRDLMLRDSAEKMQSSDATIDSNDSASDDTPSEKERDAIDCWIGGGEGIYREALQHENAREVHLTRIDIPADSVRSTKNAEIAHFPLDSLRSDVFKETSRRQDGVCTFCLYERRL